MSKIAFFCCIQGEDPLYPFEVEIDSAKDISDLKEAIKEEAPHSLAGIDALELDLFKVSIPIVDINEKVQGIRRGDDVERAEELVVSDKLYDVFKETPDEKKVHIIVVGPTGTLILSWFTFGHTLKQVWFFAHFHLVQLANVVL